MSSLPKIVEDLTGDNYLIDRQINRMEGKTIKNVFRGRRESEVDVHESEALHIEFDDGEILVIITGSNVFHLKSKVKPQDVHVDFMFRWEPGTPSM